MKRITITQQNLLKAMAGESLARNKYTQFAKIARKEEYEWIAQIFEETANNEKAHTEEIYEQINNHIVVSTNLEIKAYGKTADNLKLAVEGEHYEWNIMYPDFEKAAIGEKQLESARLFSQIKKVEEKHEERYLIIAKKLNNKTLYDSDTELEWKCLNCGYIYKGKTPPKECPVCKKPFTWYMPLRLVR
ncbi:MAG: ferritin family protein [Microgenomates group bacterium]|jgi:rubrerythrin|nr:ferritin family protein [Microgenomates group bacterium]